MAKKITPQELRARARMIIKQAKEIESMSNVKIGRYVRSIAVKDFNISYEEFKRNIVAIIAEK